MNKDSTSTRILGYDFARALAVIGMVLVNFKIVFNAGQRGPDWLVWFAGLFNGRAAATFVILAGVGLTLFSKKTVRQNDGPGIKKTRFLLWKRSVFLLVVGLAYTPVWPADILHFYAIYIAVGALLITASDKKLVGAAFAFMGVFLVLLMFFNYETNWNWTTLNYENFWTVKGMVMHLFYNGFHPVFPWTFFLLMGMWLGRRDMRDRRVRRRILLVSLGIAAVTEFLSWWGIRSVSPEAWGLSELEIQSILGTGPMPPMPQYLLAAGATAVVVICLSIMLTEKFKTARWIKVFVSSGQMALTLYVAHVIIGMGILEVFDLLQGRSLAFAFAYTFMFCSVGFVFSYYWRKRFRRGPLETLMRRVTGGA